MRMKKFFVTFALCLSACCLGGATLLMTDGSAATEANVVYVNGTAATSGDGATVATAVKTFEEGYEKLPSEGGTIVLCGDITVNAATQTNGCQTYSMASKPVTITGSYGNADYEPVWTVENGATSGVKKAYIQFNAATVLENLTINRSQTLAESDKCVELWSGPSLTVGEGVEFTNNGAELAAGYANGQIAVRLGNVSETLATASYTQRSGAVSYIQGGNNKTNVTASSIEVSGTAKILDMLQGGGTNCDVGSSTVKIGGNAEVGTLYVNGYGTADLGSSDITIDGATVGALEATRAGAAGTIAGNVDIEVKNGATVKDFSLGGITIAGTKSLTISGGSTVYVTGEYTVPVNVLTVNDTSKFVLNPCLNATLPTFSGDGSVVGEHVMEKNPLAGTGDNYSVEVIMSGDDIVQMQGTAVYDDYLFLSNNRGYCYVYSISEKTLLGEFNLASGTPDGTVDTNYLNHANQMMFGPDKFDENDQFPLLYITTGNSGDHDTDGSYISKCAVERISRNGSTWSSELVQTIQFNDAANIPDAEKDGDLLNMYDAEDKKFYYTSGNGYDSAKGYQKIGWGWAASFVDTDPTDVTRDKFYLFCPRFRTTFDQEEANKSKYGITDYYTDNNYIITAFDMPALPASANDPAYGATVTLYPKDIVDQFETEYDVYYTQGGTMYQGRIYYSFGNPTKEWNGTKPYVNAIRVFDIEKERIVSRLDLSLDKTVTNIGAKEPECCAFYNGKLLLSGGYRSDSPGNVIYLFDFLEFHVETESTCMQGGTDYTVCAYCGQRSSEVKTTSKAAHTMTYHAAVSATCTKDGSKAYYHCSGCGKNYADASGNIELTDVTVKAGHKLVKVEAKAATETENGNKEHYRCSECGKLYADAEGKTELTEADIVIAATGTGSSENGGETTDGCGSVITVGAIGGVPLITAAASLLLDKKRKRK